VSAKTHKGIAKRMKVTGRGKLRRRHTGTRKHMSHKASKRKRRLRGWTKLSDGDARRIVRQYGPL